MCAPFTKGSASALMFIDFAVSFDELYVLSSEHAEHSKDNVMHVSTIVVKCILLNIIVCI